MAIDISKTLQAVATIAEQLGVDMSAYGNASPLKIITTVLTDSVAILQQTTQVALTEQNPLTATEFKSRLGLAALVGLNPAQLLKASIGKLTVRPNGHTVTIAQHAKVKSYDNIDYYVVLPNDSVMFSQDTELILKQGILRTQAFTATGDKWETFRLTVNNYVDSTSIEAFRGSTRLKAGFKLDEQADIYVRNAYDGTTELVVGPGLVLSEGEAINVQYAECLGIDGDNIEAGQLFSGEQFAYEGDNDVTGECTLVLTEPCIGGTDFAVFDKDLSNEIMLAGHNNLIGTEAQLLQYARRFKQYTIMSAEVVDQVFRVTAIRSLEQLTKNVGYWLAITDVTMRAEDILALSQHLNNYSKKSIDLLISVKPAIEEQCKVNVNVSMTNPSVEAIEQIVTQYLLDQLPEGTYEVGGLYKQLLSMPDVQECYVSFEGNVNSFGTAMPKSPDAILLCTAAKLTINGKSYDYGSYDPSATGDISTIVDDVTTDRIVTIDKNAYES